MNLATESSAPSAAERRVSVSEFQSQIVWDKDAALVNVSISKGVICQRVVISDMPNWGDKVIRRYTGYTLQTFVKHYDSTISPPFFFRDSHFSCSRMPVMLPVSLR